MRRTAIAVALWTLVVCGAPARSQQPPQTPQVKAEQQAERPKENQADAERPAQEPQPSIAANSDKANPSADAKHSEQEGSEFWPPFLGMRVKITDSLLVLFTSILAIFTGTLWGATSRLVKGAEQTSARQLRAYLGVDSAEIFSGFNEGERLVVEFGVKNFGQTPAYKCVGSVNCALLDFDGDVPMDFPEDLDPQRIGTIHQGAIMHKSLHKQFTDTERAALIAGRKAIWLFGQYTYEVAFDTLPRTTKFRYFVAAYAPGEVPKLFGLSAYGNEAT